MRSVGNPSILDFPYVLFISIGPGGVACFAWCFGRCVRWLGALVFFVTREKSFMVCPPIYIIEWR